MTTITQTEWVDASTSTYNAESTMVGDFKVTVCLDDEGPLMPAYYWDIASFGTRFADGWARNPKLAKSGALAAAAMWIHRMDHDYDGEGHDE